MKNQIVVLILFFILIMTVKTVSGAQNSGIIPPADSSTTLRFPFIGAQVFIEPGQTKEEIDTWFRVLKENKFTVCRIRMFESYMKKEDGSWEFYPF